MPTGFASTMILVSLYSEKYGIAVAKRECGLDAVQRVSQRLLPFPSCIIACELAKGFSDGGIVPKRGAVLAMPRKERSSVGFRG